MITIPLIYFLFLLSFHYLKNGRKFDIACYMLFIYSISALCSLLLDIFHIRSADTMYYKISMNATITYCLLITLGILPFMIYSNSRIVTMQPTSKSGLLKVLAWVFFFWFLFYSIMSFESLVKILTGDLGELRSIHYLGMGEEKWFAHFPFIMRLPFTFMNLVTGSTWVLIFLGFYSVSVQKLPNKIGVLYIIGSLVGIVRNVVSAGRSDMVYWLIGLGACCVFFYPCFNRRQWKIIRKYLFVLAGLFVFYIITATISRFGEREMGEISGAEGGFLSYAGQSFINFCYFWDNFTCPLPSLEILFPFTYNLLGISVGGPVEIQQLLTMQTGHSLGVFYTYIGQIAVASHNYVAIAYCIVHALLSYGVARKVKSINAHILQCYLYLLFSSVVFLGIFSHYYCFHTKTFSIISLGFIILYLSNSRLKKSSIYRFR